MIQVIKNYMRKYHEANLWIAHRAIMEGKKQISETQLKPEISIYDNAAVYQQPQVVFTHSDIGHNQEETNRIQELYNELDGLPLLPRLAFI